MKLQNIKKLGSDSNELTRVQEYISRCFGGIIGSEIIDGVLLQEVDLTAGQNEISHRLGRKLRGWVVVRQRANVGIWDEQDSNSKPHLTLVLQASGPVTVDLWIF